MAGHEYRLAHLDTLRFVAAALVVFQHLFEHRPGFAGEVLVPLGPGVAGVALFFFISGFVIPFSVGDRIDVGRFFVRRVFRIYPLFLVAIVMLVIGALTGFLPQWRWIVDAPPKAWLANLLLIQDFVGQKAFLGVTWTLAIELIWYAGFAICLVWCKDRAADALDRIVPVSLIVLAAVSLLIDHRIPLGRPTMIYAAVIGFQCFRFVTGKIATPMLVRSVSQFVVITAATTYIAFGHFGHPDITLAQAMGPWALGTTIFLLTVLTPSVRQQGWLNSGLLPWLGAMSYSMYLLHPIANAIAFTHYPNAGYAAALILTLLFSWAGYRFVERPGIRIGKMVANRLPSNGAGMTRARGAGV